MVAKGGLPVLREPERPVEVDVARARSEQARVAVRPHTILRAAGRQHAHEVILSSAVSPRPAPTEVG